MKSSQMPPQRNPPPPKSASCSRTSSTECLAEIIQEATAVQSCQGGGKSDCAVVVDLAPIKQAISSLEHAFELAPQVVQSFLNGVHSSSQIICIHRDDCAASGAGEIRVVLKPSDFLADFLSTFPTGNIE
ncbi:hypothetical protein FEE59_22150 [Herbaspirillum sp. RU 5E]|nr:hypothetical protein [Herbaspirillum sp. RU 5E]